MPIIFPRSFKLKKDIVKMTQQIVQRLKNDKNFNTSDFENKMDTLFYKIYKINDLDKSRIEKFSKNFYEEL